MFPRLHFRSDAWRGGALRPPRPPPTSPLLNNLCSPPAQAFAQQVVTNDLIVNPSRGGAFQQGTQRPFVCRQEVETRPHAAHFKARPCTGERERTRALLPLIPASAPGRGCTCGGAVTRRME